MNHDSTQYFEAVPVERELPKESEWYFAITNQRSEMICFLDSISPNVIWLTLEGDLRNNESVTHWLRPLPLPVGVPTDEEINEWVDQSGLIDNGEKCFRDGLKAMRSRLIPLLSAQAAEIEQLKARVKELENYVHTDNTEVILNLERQLSTEQAKGRERAIGILKWFKENYGHGFDPEKMYDLYLSTLTSTDQHEGK